jgi:hypothetical protein
MPWLLNWDCASEICGYAMHGFQNIISEEILLSKFWVRCCEFEFRNRSAVGSPVPVRSFNLESSTWTHLKSSQTLQLELSVFNLKYPRSWNSARFLRIYFKQLHFHLNSGSSTWTLSLQLELWVRVQVRFGSVRFGSVLGSSPHFKLSQVIMIFKNSKIQILQLTSCCVNLFHPATSTMILI